MGLRVVRRRKHYRHALLASGCTHVRRMVLVKVLEQPFGVRWIHINVVLCMDQHDICSDGRDPGFGIEMGRQKRIQKPRLHFWEEGKGLQNGNELE